MLIPLADEGEFLLLLAGPGPSGGAESEWVVPIGDQQGEDGWALIFPSDLDLGDGAEVDVDVERLNAKPAELPPLYEDVVEVSSRTGGGIVGSGLEIEAVPATNQPHRIRLSRHHVGGNFQLLVQSWPAPLHATVVLRHGRTDDRSSIPALGLPGAGRAIEAARRIGNDVDRGPGFRELSGGVGIARASIVLPKSRAYHAEFFGQVYVWTPDPDGSVAEYENSPWNPSDPSSNWRICAMPTPEHLDRITGWRGAIWSRPHPDDNPPGQSVIWWRWVRREPPPVLDVDLGEMGEPILAQDTVRAARFSEVPGSDPRTEIVIEHRDVPVEWVDDLSIWWAFQLAIHAIRE